MKNNSYNTKQKDMILDMIISQKDEFSIKDIYSKLEGKVGLTTIYRVINNLILQGKLDKEIKENNCAYYHYLESCDKNNHFYLKCDLCGHITHVDCNCIKELSNHVLYEHDFSINNKKTILSGICSECKKRG